MSNVNDLQAKLAAQGGIPMPVPGGAPPKKKKKNRKKNKNKKKQDEQSPELSHPTLDRPRGPAKTKKSVEEEPKRVEAEPKPEPKRVEAGATVEAESTQADEEPKQAEAESKQIENEPKQVEAEPKQVEAEPKQVEAEPKQVEAEPQVEEESKEAEDEETIQVKQKDTAKQAEAEAEAKKQAEAEAKKQAEAEAEAKKQAEAEAEAKKVEAAAKIASNHAKKLAAQKTAKAQKQADGAVSRARADAEKAEKDAAKLRNENDELRARIERLEADVAREKKARKDAENATKRAAAKSGSATELQNALDDAMRQADDLQDKFEKEAVKTARLEAAVEGYKKAAQLAQDEAEKRVHAAVLDSREARCLVSQLEKELSQLRSSALAEQEAEARKQQVTAQALQEEVQAKADRIAALEQELQQTQANLGLLDEDGRLPKEMSQDEFRKLLVHALNLEDRVQLLQQQLAHSHARSKASLTCYSASRGAQAHFDDFAVHWRAAGGSDSKLTSHASSTRTGKTKKTALTPLEEFHATNRRYGVSLREAADAAPSRQQRFSAHALVQQQQQRKPLGIASPLAGVPRSRAYKNARAQLDAALADVFDF